MLQDVLQYGEEVHQRHHIQLMNDGKGPAWANSLFEDNAEFGFGMFLGTSQLRDKVEMSADKALTSNTSEALKAALSEWIENKQDAEGSKAAAAKMLPLLEA